MDEVCIKCEDPRIIEEIAVRRGIPYKRNVCKNCKAVHMTLEQMQYLIEQTKQNLKSQEISTDA